MIDIRTQRKIRKIGQLLDDCQKTINLLEGYAYLVKQPRNKRAAMISNLPEAQAGLYGRWEKDGIEDAAIVLTTLVRDTP